MSDLISREEVLNLLDTAFENGAFDGRYAYENLIDAVQNLIHPLETKALEKEPCDDAVSRQAAINAFERFIHELGINDEPYNYGEMALSAQNVSSVELKKCVDCISRQAVNKLVDELARAISDEKCHIQRGRNYGRIMHDILELPSVEPEQQGRECASCKHSNNGECAYTEECHKCMWESQYERQVEPERKTGKWISAKVGKLFSSNDFKCSECGNILDFNGVNGGRGDANYCPNCGVKMEEVHDADSN